MLQTTYILSIINLLPPTNVDDSHDALFAAPFAVIANYPLGLSQDDKLTFPLNASPLDNTKQASVILSSKYPC